jgi:tetratricopeptide (TPR) repeat protein
VRRITSIDSSRAECLRHALEYDWLATYCETAQGVAFFFDRARLWRSLALVAHPETDPEVWRKVGFTAARQDQQNYKLAVDAYTEAIALTPMNADLYLRRGDAHLALGEQRLQAYQDLRTSRTEKRSSGPHDSMLRPYMHAISDFSKAIELEPDSAVGYNSRGTVHAAIGNETRALADYSNAIDLDPDYVEAYQNRSRSFDRTGDKEKSAADAEKRSRLERFPRLHRRERKLPASVTE